ncbi:MAG: radical SAM protein, partial [Turicibacter sp.]|nr:radical SAM protein [Turicibacter sp.]
AHYLVLGDGEIPMENLLRHLFEGERLQTGEHIASPGDTQGKSMYYNKTIDWLPIFDYYTGYLPQKNGNKIYCLQSKNNICTGNCSFCPGRRGRCQYKADSQIVREISHVANSYGVVNFFFTDDNLFDPDNRMAKDRLKGLCLAIKAANLKKIKFSCYAKAISLRDCPEDRELLLLMKETGFIAIFIGIEAGNEADLLLYRKRATVADNYRSIEMLREAGIMPLMGFINFNPYSTKQTLKENYDFLLAVDPQNLVDSFAKALIVYKYTGIYDKLQRDGLLIDGYEYLDEATRWQFLDPSVKTIHDTVEKKLFPLFTNFNKEYQKSLASFNFHKKLNKNAARFEGQFEVVYQGQIDAINAYLAKLIENGDEAGFRELDQACHRSTARLRQLDMAMFGIDIPLE